MDGALFFILIYAIGGYLGLHGASLLEAGRHAHYLRCFFVSAKSPGVSIDCFDNSPFYRR